MNTDEQLGLNDWELFNNVWNMCIKLMHTEQNVPCLYHLAAWHLSRLVVKVITRYVIWSVVKS